MGPGPLLEGLHKGVIHAAHQQVSHGCCHGLDGIPESVWGAIQGEISEITRQIGIAGVPCRAGSTHHGHGGAVAPQLAVRREQQHRFRSALAHHQPIKRIAMVATGLQLRHRH